MSLDSFEDALAAGKRPLMLTPAGLNAVPKASSVTLEQHV